MNNPSQNPKQFDPPDPDLWRRPLPSYGRPPRRRKRWRLIPRYASPRRRRRRFPFLGCLFLSTPLIFLLLVLGIYFFFPMRTDILLLGIDYAEPPSVVARTDTIMLTTVEPSRPYVGMLSIPRDLWVMIPRFGENRINTAHFFAEAEQPGSGPAAVIETVALNFGVKADYYMRVRFEGFRDVVEALGGVEINLTEPRAGYPAGRHFLKPRKALAFVRDRATSDDFSRMSNGQFMLQSLMKNLLFPRNWMRIPAVIEASTQVVDTNIPKWLWPRLALAMMRVGPNGIDSRVINRDMVFPFTTDMGANVLAPNWEIINPIVEEMFAH